MSLRRAAGDVPEHHFLGDAAAVQRREAREHPALRVVVGVLLRNVHRAPERAAARNDGDLVHGQVAVVHHRADERVARLVVGHDLLVLIVHDPPAFAAELHLLPRILDVMHVDALLVAARGQKRGLIEQVGQLGAGKPGRAARHDAQVHILGDGELAGMHPEDLLAAHADRAGR